MAPTSGPHPPLSDSAPSFVARTPLDLVALVPVVLGFHPCDSVVLLTFAGPGRSFHARVDLPGSGPAPGAVGSAGTSRPSDLAAQQAEVVDLLGGAVAAHRIPRAAVVLYTGADALASQQAALLVARLVDLECDVVDVVRVDDGRWFPVPDDGSPGTPFDLASHRFTAEHVLAGGVVRPDRAALAASLERGEDQAAAADAVEVALAATRTADRLMACAARGEQPLLEEAEWVRRRVRRRVADGRRLDAGDAGRLLALAALVPTRDVAWQLIGRVDSAHHVELWRDLVRRAPRELVPAPASLLAFAAWQHGDGALAWCGVDRAQAVDPGYSMAGCVAEVLRRAVPPEAWERPRAPLRPRPRHQPRQSPRRLR